MIIFTIFMFLMWCFSGFMFYIESDYYDVLNLGKGALIFFGPIIWLMYLFKTKGSNMFKKNSIDGALEQRAKVEDLEKKIEKMKKVRDELKDKAKEDLKWIME